MSVIPVVIAAAAAIAVAVPASHTNSNGLSTDTTPLLSFGVGGFDVRNNAERDIATDMRVEYRFGEPLYYVFKPLIALEANSDGSGGAFAGIAADWMIQDRFTVTPSFAAGLWSSGSGKDLGSAIEFRSQIELGYRFENSWRVSGAFAHISNGGLADRNPGVETATVYLHVPADTLLPR